MDNIKVVFFDYYYTLVEIIDPFNQINSWIKNKLECLNGEVDPNKFLSKFLRNRAKISTDNKFRLGIEILGESLANTCKLFEINDYLDEFIPFVESIFIHTSAYADANSTIEQLKSKYKVGLLTNADNYILEKSLQYHNFNFDFIVTSEDARSNKPSDKIFKYALSRLQIHPEDVVMIGDSQNDDIYGANNNNISCIWINRNNEQLKYGITPNVVVTNLNETLFYL